MKFILTCNDIVFADDWFYPRYAHRAFLVSLDATMKDYLGYGVDVTLYGKPEENTFRYTEKQLRRLYEGKKVLHKTEDGKIIEKEI